MKIDIYYILSFIIISITCCQLVPYINCEETHILLKKHFLRKKNARRGNDLFYVESDGFAMLHRRLPNGTIAEVEDEATPPQQDEIVTTTCIHVKHADDSFEDVQDVPYLIPIINNTVNRFFHYMVDTGSIWKPKYPLCNDEKYIPKHRWSLKTILLSLVKENLKDASFRKQVNISRIEYALKKVLPSYIKAVQNETRKNASLSKDYARVRKYKHVYVENGEDEVTKIQQLIIERLKQRELYHRKHQNSTYFKYYGQFMNQAINNAEFNPKVYNAVNDATVSTNARNNMTRESFINDYIEPIVENTTKVERKRQKLEGEIDKTKIDMVITKGIIRHDKRLIEQVKYVKIPKQNQMFQNLLKENQIKSKKIDFENVLN